MIKNIVFDMGGVLIVFDPLRFVNKLGYTDALADELAHRIYINETWAAMDAGTINAEAGHQKVVSTVDEQYRYDAIRLAYDWWRMFDPMEGMLELIQNLKKEGYGIYLLSNAADDHPYYWNQLPYKDYFDGLYVSAFHRKIKPNREIYQDFVDTFKLDKSECVFIDDSQRNVDAGNAFGMTSHVFKGCAELKDFLKTLKVKID